jgi:hypothetical protein
VQSESEERGKTPTRYYPCAGEDEHVETATSRFSALRFGLTEHAHGVVHSRLQRVARGQRSLLERLGRHREQIRTCGPAVSVMHLQVAQAREHRLLNVTRLQVGGEPAVRANTHNNNGVSLCQRSDVCTLLDVCADNLLVTFTAKRHGAIRKTVFPLHQQLAATRGAEDPIKLRGRLFLEARSVKRSEGKGAPRGQYRRGLPALVISIHCVRPTPAFARVQHVDARATKSTNVKLQLLVSKQCK